LDIPHVPGGRRKMKSPEVASLNNHEAALAKVKSLRGLIPIRSSCKKVRDDQGYWRRVEEYIREHSEAEFTHGICPECKKKLYPGL